MSRKQTDNRFWRIKKGEPIPEWLQKGATDAGMVAGDDLIVIPSETEGYDVYLADPNSSKPMMKVTAENMPEGFLITGAPTCFRTTSSLHYTIGTLQKENEALADALRGLLKAYENAFDWSAELTPETAEAERIANEVLEDLTAGKPERAVPSGWKLVPEEPSDEMVEAVRKKQSEEGFSPDNSECPAAPTADKPILDLLREARWFVEVYDNRESNSEVDSLLSRIDAILRAAPTAGGGDAR